MLRGCNLVFTSTHQHEHSSGSRPFVAQLTLAAAVAPAPPALTSRLPGYSFRTPAYAVNHTIPAAPGPQATRVPAPIYQIPGHPHAHQSIGYAAPVAPAPHPISPVFGMPSHGNGAAGRGRPAYDGNTFHPDYVHDPITKFWMNRRTTDILAFFPGAGQGSGFSQASHPHYSVAQTRYGYPLVRENHGDST